MVESERTRIARDLHDGIGQSLNLARIKIGDLAQRPDARVFSAPLREVMDIIDDTNTIIRTLEFDLSPPVLRELGLAPALEWLADELRRMYGLHVNLSDDGEPKPLDQLRRAIAFRSVRELLINVVRHAGTNRAHVDMQLASNTLVVTVSDEGKGFEAAVTPSGFGLQSVRERLTHVGGRTDIAAAPDEGTVVTLTLPLRLGTTEEITA